MENMVIEASFWNGKKVLLTGHTGFKGSWLSLWLQQLGADVYGVALQPTTSPNLFDLADVENGMTSVIADINDLASLHTHFQKFQPEIVIHMAAQALVRYSYSQPVETYQTNVMGTMNVLECIRAHDSVKAAIMVTTDKCYENKEWQRPYHEQDVLGGHDPYSSSKACAELLIESYRRSFFYDETSAAIASVRAGNVIGGGDWSEDRLIPDIVRAKQSQASMKIRYPEATRPWQHVLEPLSGYLLLAQRLYVDGRQYAQAWNFGPNQHDVKSVKWIADFFKQTWPDFAWQFEGEYQPHEANTLKLDCTKAKEQLAWQPKWPIETALEHVISWFDAVEQDSEMKHFCLQQIESYNHCEKNNY